MLTPSREVTLPSTVIFFGGVLCQLAIERLVFADEQISFAVICFQPNW
jgi:hypothetical protein